MKLYKYHGAGNDFLLIDNRNGDICLTVEQIQQLCHRHLGIGADGLMLLNAGDNDVDFGMEYYNSDGSGGMMCGNGARCMVAFAADLGFKSYRFRASDGFHCGNLVVDGNPKIISVLMKDVNEVRCVGTNDFFLDTGTRHLVRFVDCVDELTIDDVARQLRHDPRFAPIGTNVNYVFKDGDTLRMSTFEKGVEAETMACGTGVVAAALAAATRYADVKSPVKVVTKGGEFTVEFKRGIDFHDIYLTGPAQFVAEIIVK